MENYRPLGLTDIPYVMDLLIWTRRPAPTEVLSAQPSSVRVHK